MTDINYFSVTMGTDLSKFTSIGESNVPEALDFLIAYFLLTHGTHLRDSGRSLHLRPVCSVMENT